MDPLAPEQQREQRKERLQSVLDKLTASGMSQAEIARRLNVPASYLSDVKNGYRTLTELFARRVGDEFGVDYVWLLDGAGNGEKPSMVPVSGRAGKLLLSVLSGPCIGDPAVSSASEGILQEVSGPAAVSAANADKPYLLRLGRDVHSLDLRVGDLLLMSQKVDGGQHGILVLQAASTPSADSGKLILVKRKGKEQFQELEQVRTLRGEVVGVCLGLAWRAL